MKTPCHDATSSRLTTRVAVDSVAFTLIEVMLAMAMFFAAVFAVLALVSTSLRNARALQSDRVDASALAAFLTVSNRLEEGLFSGDFGDLFPDYQFDYEVIPITNGLTRVDMLVRARQPRGSGVSTLSLLLYHGQSGVQSPMSSPTLPVRR
ncbi:MAG: hypothetical protein RMN51_06685 [Verrucomicrobiota bacterium]|nr:hypothetical protein [Limisphaera sp.]MDW8381777.1 hypothetical protein [Verrucomicrobiota bacterium]